MKASTQPTAKDDGRGSHFMQQPAIVSAYDVGPKVSSGQSWLQVPLPSFLPLLAFVFLTYSCVSAAYKVRTDIPTLAFVVSSYALLVVLFWAFREFERTPTEETWKRKRLVAAVWTLSTALNLSFSYRVSQILPFPMAVAVWCTAALFVVFGFWICFVYRDADATRVDKHIGECEP